MYNIIISLKSGCSVIFFIEFCVSSPLFQRFLSFGILEINFFTDSLLKNRNCIKIILFCSLHIDALHLYCNYQASMQHTTFTVDQLALTYPESHVHALHMQIYIAKLITPHTSYFIVSMNSVTLIIY